MAYSVIHNRIEVQKPCAGYYLRWYYNGWHYWWFLPGKISIKTEGEKYRTLGVMRIAMSSGQVNRQQAAAIRTIKSTREISILTDVGWRNLRIEPGSIVIYDSKIAGAEIEFIAVIGSRSVSVQNNGFSPEYVTPPIPPEPETPYAGFGMLYNKQSAAGIIVPPIDLAGVLFVDNSDPANVYYYNPDTQVSTLLPIPGIMAVSYDIAHTPNKLWLMRWVGDLDMVFDEWNITLNPFTAVFNRTITNAPYSAGLHAVDDEHLISFGYNGEGDYWFLQYVDVSGLTASIIDVFPLQRNRIIQGDIILTTTRKVITLEFDIVEQKTFIVQYEWGETGNIEVEHDITDVFESDDGAFGLFEYDGEIYIAGIQYYNEGKVYHIDKNCPYDITEVDTPGYPVIGASQLAGALTEHLLPCASPPISPPTGDPFIIRLDATGDGSGVGRFWLYVSDYTTITIDGAGHFYSDIAGTLDESTSLDLLPGGNLFYVRVPSGTSYVTFPDGTLLTQWGNVHLVDGWYYNYSNGWEASGNAPTLVLALSTLPANLIQIGWSYNIEISGSLSDLKPALTTFYIVNGNNSIDPDISNMPDTLINFAIIGAGTTWEGSIEDISPIMELFQVNDSNIISGSIATLPSSLLCITVYGSNTISGAIGDMNCPDLKTLTISGVNTIEGTIEDLPSGLKQFELFGNNTVGGELVLLPSGLTDLQIAGYNTLWGDIADIPSTVTAIYILGGNTVTGDLADLPPLYYDFTVSGSNTIYGDVDSIPSGCWRFVVYGANTISGDIANVPLSVTQFAVTGNNTISGDIADIPVNMNDFYVQGANTLSGDIADMPNIVKVQISGSNSISDYSGKSWGILNVFKISPSSGGLSSSEMDNLIIDLAAATWATSGSWLQLQGTNANRTAASDAAKATLVAKPVTYIQLNE